MDKVIRFLEQSSVEKIYFCAGARNNQILKSIKGKFEIEFCVDERSASFMALGYTKLTKKPVAVCTTSGTAVSECLSACIEAFYSHEKMIFLTADRPKRLHDTYAPQTIKQDVILKDFCRSTFYGETHNFKMIESSYPIHINLEINHLAYNLSKDIKEINQSQFDELQSIKSKAIAIITEGVSDTSIISKLIEKNVSYYIESTSAAQTISTDLEIKYEKDLLGLVENEKNLLILKYGKTPITKLWRVLDSKNNHSVVAMDSYPLGTSVGFKSSTELKLTKVFEKPEVKHSNLFECINKFPKSEIKIIHDILKELSEQSILFVGNSMPIRYVDLLKIKTKNVYASRGANGIDGQIATAIGMAQASNEEVHCLVGDLTFLYDISSVFQNWPSNLTIHVINNYGGRIFERVNVDKDLVLAHNTCLRDLVGDTPAKNYIKEYFPCNNETNEFWSEWNK